MADFEERLDALLLRAKEIQAHKAADSYDDIFKHQHEADVWMNNAYYFIAVPMHLVKPLPAWKA